MLGCMMHLDLARNPPRFTRIEHFIEHRERVYIQLVHHQPYLLGLRKMHIHQILETMRHVQHRAALRDFNMSPATLWADKHKQVTRALALVFVILAFWSTRSSRNDRAHFADQLIRTLIKAHSRTPGVFDLGIQVQHILHMIDKPGAHRRDDPLLDAPGFENVFFSVRRTVSSEIASTSESATNSSASNCMVQRFWPSGGVEQAVAIRRASCLASSLRLAPGRGCSLSAASRLPSTNFWRVRSTVRLPMCRAAAIAASVAPSSALSKMWARLSLRAPRVPFLIRSSNCDRSASVRSTIYFLFIGSSCWL